VSALRALRASALRASRASALCLLIAIAFLAFLPGATAQKPEKSVLTKPLEAPKAKFEPRQKFEDGPLGVAASAVDLPPPGPELDHGFVGPHGTIHVCGWQGEASFLWPIDGKTPRLYREGLVYTNSEADGLVFRLTGRYYRVWFKLATKPDASGKYPVWIRNGDRDWLLYQAAVVAPHAP
jgi:hypothetical protein